MDLTNLVLLEEFGDIQKQIVTLKATDPAISYKKIIEEIKKARIFAYQQHQLLRWRSTCLSTTSSIAPMKKVNLFINNINCSDEGQLAYQQQHQLLRWRRSTCLSTTSTATVAVPLFNEYLENNSKFYLFLIFCRNFSSSASISLWAVLLLFRFTIFLVLYFGVFT